MITEQSMEDIHKGYCQDRQVHHNKSMTNFITLLLPSFLHHHAIPLIGVVCEERGQLPELEVGVLGVITPEPVPCSLVKLMDLLDSLISIFAQGDIPVTLAECGNVEEEVELGDKVHTKSF